MRLWTLHPRYLDRQGLVALWREALLAQAVLSGNTKGYRHHPQLARFQDQPDPLAAIGSYLDVVLAEAQQRGYRFDAAKINPRRSDLQIQVTEDQLHREWQHLERKLLHRSPQWLEKVARNDDPEPHPMFQLVPGEVSQGEKLM